MLRQLARMAGWLGVALPVVVIGVWGTLYVQSCLLVLSAPGVPLEVVYESPAGPLRFEAKAYSFDYRENELFVEGLSILEPDGTAMLKAQRVRVADAFPGRRPIRVEASDVVARLERADDGSFKFERYLPPSTEEPPSPQPYAVDIEALSVLFVDHAGDAEWRKWLSMRAVALDGAGALWSAATDVKIDQVGVVRMRARQDDDGFALRFQTLGTTQLATLIDHLKRAPEGRDLPELRDLKSTSLTANGYAAVFLPKDRPVRWNADFSIAATQVAYANDFAATSATASGSLSPDGFIGSVRASSSGSEYRFDGSWNWSKGVQIAGKVEADIQGPQGLPAPLRPMLTREASFSGAALAGWAEYSGGRDFRLLGDLKAKSVGWNQLSAKSIVGKVDASDKRVLITSLSGQVADSQATGFISFRPESGILAGYVRAPGVGLGDPLRKAGLIAFDGRADLNAVVFGTADNPRVAFRASGSGKSTQPGYEMRLGNFEAVGTYRSDRVDLDRFSIVGPAGSTTASGRWDMARDALKIDVLSTSVPLQAFLTDISGSLAFSGRVEGTSKKPLVKGQVEVFGGKVAGREIQFARGDIVADSRGLSAERVLAFKRGAQAFGSGSVAFESKRIDGSFRISGIELANYPPEGMTGIATISDGRIGGTIDSPSLEATIAAENVVAANIPLEELTAKTFIKNGILRVDQAVGSLDGGTVTGSAVFDMNANTGQFDGQVHSVSLRSLVGGMMSQASVEGLLNGRIQGAFSNANLTAFSGDLFVEKMKLNDAFLGNGQVVAKSTDGNEWEGSAFLGDLNSYIQVPNANFNVSANEMKADVVADNIEVGLLYDAAKRYLVDAQGSSLLPEQVQEKIASIEGKIDVDAKLGGKIDDVNLELSAFSLSKLAIAGQVAGEVLAKGSRKDRVWTIDQLQWDGGPGLFKVNKGVIDERGESNVDGEVRGFSWNWLAAFDKRLAAVAGKSDVSFLVSGLTSSPRIDASVSYEEGGSMASLTPWPGVTVPVRQGTGKSRRVDLESVVVQDGRIDATGVFNFEGFTGSLSALIPFKYPFEIPESETLDVRARIPSRPLASLNEFFELLNPKETEGDFSASLQLGGTRIKPEIKGNFELNGKNVAFRGQATALQDVSLLAKFQNDKVEVSASGKSSKGGTFESEGLAFSLDNLEDLFGGSGDGLLANRLFGTFRLNSMGLEYVDPQSGPMNAVLSGALEAGGTLRQPEIKGTILVDSANLVVPTLETTDRGASSFPINPKFDVSVVTTNNLVLRAGTGKFELSGGGNINGSLQNPNVSTVLEVEKGTVRLPNARVSIEPGGTVTLVYRSNGSGAFVSRAEVDLTGRTQVTAQSFAGVVERYDITLTIRGDLLAQDGLQLRAQSDPADLSSDRILAILGQGDILTSQSGENFRADRQLQSALLGLAVPYFAGSFTEQFASKLGLDYLNIEYNSFEQFSVTAAISLSKDFVISARRQLSSPLPGERLKYDLRLSYRPPFRSKALRRFTFSVGTDQDRPWKVSVEYGIRF